MRSRERRKKQETHYVSVPSWTSQSSLREGGVSGLSPQDQEHFWVASLAPFLRAIGTHNGCGSLECTAECGFTKPHHQQNSPLQPTQQRALLSCDPQKNPSRWAFPHLVDKKMKLTFCVPKHL